MATQSPGFNIIEEYTLDEANAAVGAMKVDKKPAEETSHAGKVETDTLVCTEFQRSGNTTIISPAVKDKTATAIMADSTDVSKYVSKLTSTGELKTSATEHCNAQKTGIPVKKPESAEQSASAPPDNQPNPALHVVTKTEGTPSLKSGPDESTESAPNSVGQRVSKQNLHVKTAVTCPEDSLVLNQYPWKSEVTFKLDQMLPLEIDIWSKKVRDYHVFSAPKEVTPIISDVKGYGLCKRPIKVEPQMDDLTEKTPTEDKMDQLIDHAKALIDTAKTFVTKPVGRKHSRKQPTAKPVKADVKPKALDILHRVTMNKLATLHVETDGSSRPSDVDSSIRKHRKIKCKMCTEIFGSVKDLNIHHKQDHGIIKCTKCNKYFSIQSSLDKHSYTHGELKFNCELCAKCFPFESRLDQHMLVHINNKLSCLKKSCDKQFKSIGDLNLHTKYHTKGSWYHCNHCDYKTKFI